MKIEKEKAIIVRMPDWLKDAIDKRAKQELMSVNAFIRQILLKTIEGGKNEGKN